ncbi:MAG: ATP synthase F1 subunit epsilon [Patescibacteria group bacterium]|nr:ATP synthase F1 subunit epsilon [Patescibacteria group bacterium]
MSKLILEIISLDKQVFNDEVDSVVLPTEEGEIGILPKHIHLVTSLAPGEIKIRQGNEETVLACSGGFAQINPDKAIVLADAAEHAEEIDEQRAEEAMKKARETMAKKDIKKEEYAAAAADLRRSLARLKVVKKRKSKRAYR